MVHLANAQQMGGQLDAAIAVGSRAVEINPELAEAHNALGSAFSAADRMEEAGHQIQHIHESGWLSGVYYPKVPSDIGASEDDPTGWIEFGLPQDLYRVKKAPPLRLIKPEEGLLVLFPSYFFHRTVPTGSEELRIRIAFDVMRAE